MSGKLDTLTVTAERLISDFGKDVEYRNKVYSEPSDDDINDGNLEGSISTTIHSVIITPPSPYNSNMINGQTIREGDAQAFLKGQNISFEPNMSDEVMIDGTEFEVININSVYSGNLIAVYELQLRVLKGV